MYLPWAVWFTMVNNTDNYDHFNIWIIFIFTVVTLCLQQIALVPWKAPRVFCLQYNSCVIHVRVAWSASSLIKTCLCITYNNNRFQKNNEQTIGFFNVNIFCWLCEIIMLHIRFVTIDKRSCYIYDIIQNDYYIRVYFNIWKYLHNFMSLPSHILDTPPNSNRK